MQHNVLLLHSATSLLTEIKNITFELINNAIKLDKKETILFGNNQIEIINNKTILFYDNSQKPISNLMIFYELHKIDVSAYNNLGEDIYILSLTYFKENVIEGVSFRE